MCGRFAFYSPSEATAELFGVTDVEALEPSFNIAPTQTIAAIRNARDGAREQVMLRWGLVPSWATDASIGNRLINARAETVAEKPSFREAFRSRRCLVLADGFYEWKKESSTKTPYLISLANSAPFAFAGLWECWHSKEGNVSIQSATIITMAANGLMATLHHRMPLLLEPATADRWLAGDNDVIDYVSGNTLPLRAWPVDRRVNNARNEGRELIEPAGEKISD